MVPYLGCGCGAGPSARSLPAAAAACLVFGPIVAGARLAAAIAIDRTFPRAVSCAHDDDSILGQLAAIMPLAVTGALAVFFAPMLFSTRPSAPQAFAGAALAAFVMAPCGIGAIGLAAAMRGPLPAAAAGFLCVAGIVDLRTWLRNAHTGRQHDALSHAIAAIACALVAGRGGAGLVHPKIAMALWACAIACGVLAYRYCSEQNPRLRIAPAIMLAGAVLAAPPPEYHATETSLEAAFAGERIDFTGVITHTGEVTTLVRYAITCCRADATPIVIRLERNVPALHGWTHARGVLVQTANGLRLRADSMNAIAPPADAFVYR